LSVYSIVQSSIQPFKLPHESTLDNMCVLLLVCLYAVHNGRDQIETTGIDERNVFLVIVLVGSTLTLVFMTVRGRYMTKRLIRFAAASIIVLVARDKTETNSPLCTEALSGDPLPRESVVKHLGTSMLATEVARSGIVRSRFRKVARQQFAVAAFHVGAAPVRRRAGHGTVPPSLNLGPPPSSLHLEAIESSPRASRYTSVNGCLGKPVLYACCCAMVARAEGQDRRILRDEDAGRRIAGSQRHARPPPARRGRAGVLLRSAIHPPRPGLGCLRARPHVVARGERVDLAGGAH
jgi:hypothetical protein